MRITSDTQKTNKPTKIIIVNQSASKRKTSLYASMHFSNSLIIFEVNYQPQDVYHISCMCLNNQWKTVYHSPVRVVKKPKNMHNDNLYKINEYLLLKITFLLKCFIVLFKPIYKNIYLTII